MKRTVLSILAAGAAVVAISAGAGAQGSVNSSREVYMTAGTHQFFVWCTGGTASYTATADGSSAEDAQKKAYEESKAKGKCWPVWQGKVGG
ncbi:MAG: hypothetical protein HXY22_12170 [Alphaproteobacteria bacterium]|nr:hypothetical protein [Alphaproteobacteria bacterium]